MPKKAIAALITAGATLALLAGCSGGQSTDAACKQIEGDLKGSVTQMQSQAAQLQSDPKGTVKKLRALDSKLSASIEKVDNGEIKSKAKTMEQSYRGLVDQIDAYAKDPQSADVSKLSASTKKLQKAGAAFDKACKA